MKFTYTHITKDYTEITKYTVNKSNKITNQIRLVLDNIYEIKLIKNKNYVKRKKFNIKY